MNDERLREMVLEALLEIAPDIDAASLDPAIAFRDQFDFDSMDQLSFVIALHQRLGVEVPERDYPLLASIDAAVSYLQERPAAARTSP